MYEDLTSPACCKPDAHRAAEGDLFFFAQPQMPGRIAVVGGRSFQPSVVARDIVMLQGCPFPKRESIGPLDQQCVPTAAQPAKAAPGYRQILAALRALPWCGAIAGHQCTPPCRLFAGRLGLHRRPDVGHERTTF
jgi:hypothetical protein